MSFILDALKKSENERQRQLGPSLAEVQVVRRHAERPWWAVGVAALLVLNLCVLLIVLMRDGDAHPTAPVQRPQAAPQPQTYGAPAAQPAQTYRPQAYQRSAPGAAEDFGGGPRVVTDPSVRSLADEAGSYAEPYPGESISADLAAAATVPEGPPLVRRIEPPAVAPVPSQSVVQPRASTNSGARASIEVLPTLNDLAASGTNLPELHLDIHVHSRNDGERFVFVNMRKYVEGDTLKEGPSVERITAEGVILNQRGLRFLLPRQ